MAATTVQLWWWSTCSSTSNLSTSFMGHKCRCFKSSFAIPGPPSISNHCLSSSQSVASHSPLRASRREFLSILLSAVGSFTLQVGGLALADIASDFKQYIDRLDGYYFRYPEGWIQVRGAGADIFFRNPVNLDENVCVEISSPSSSQYKGLNDLGSPDEAAVKVLRQYLTEFMSTRLGVRRESSIISAASRIADDGKFYYDIEVNVKSYANEQEMAVMPQDRVVQLEWDRRYLSVLGVENNRLYELRLQVPEKILAEEEKDLRGVMDSFRVIKI
eukprot:c15152_g1_i1 orf=196-1017(+)